MKTNQLFRPFGLILSLLLIPVLQSCDSLLDVDAVNGIERDDALETPENLEALLVNSYSRLQSIHLYGRNLVVFGEALADNGRATNNSGRLVPESRNQIGAHFNHWTNAYAAINELNLILEAVPNVVAVPAVSQALRNKWEGEAKFLRALYYFDLVKAYAYMPEVTVPELDQGGIPLILEGIGPNDFDKANQRQVGRSSVANVYAQIVSDLTSAVELLDDSRGVHLASKSAAMALLSRAALYSGGWQTAKEMADEAFSEGRGRFLTGTEYVEGWRLSIHPESIFELKISNPEESLGQNESIKSSYTTMRSLEFREQNSGFGDFVPHNDFVLMMGMVTSGIGATLIIEDRGEDLRSFQYDIGPGRIANRSGRRIECIKFIGKNGFDFGDNVPIIRKSEMLLNRMEASYQLGDEEAALEDLNTLKSARGLEPVELSGEELLEEILLERRKELAFEGHRFFDLKRYGRDIIKLQGDVPFSDFRILAPIPELEIRLNQNLQQNAGY